jgi:ABC-type multidrug transport system fused ATPase/permease subunit
VRLAPFARPHWRQLSFVSLLLLLGIALEVLSPWPIKLLVDYVLSQPSPADTPGWILALLSAHSRVTLVAALAALTVLLFAANQLVGIVQGYVRTGVGNRMAYGLGAELFDHVQRLSMRFHGLQPAADLMRRVIGESGCVRDLVLSVLFPILTSLVTLTAMFAVMWRLDRSLSLVALLAAPPLLVLVRFFSGPMEDRTYRHLKLQGEMASQAEQTLTALPMVQAFGREQYETDRFRRLGVRAVDASLSTLRSQLAFKYGTSGVTAAGTAAILLLGGLHVLQGSLSAGGLLVFLSYLTSLYSPLETLAHLSSGFASAAAAARRVLEVFEKDESVQEAPSAKPLPPRPAGEGWHVRIENVTFGYERGRPILQEVTLDALPGEVVALVGPTGAGKTTLVSLIPRFFDPWKGSITVDGMDVRNLQLASLRHQIAVVLQEPFLLPLTVAENIAYGRPGATRAQIEAAAEQANALEFIRRLPDGLDASIGEWGATLSGGEKQRLAIARALLKDSPILIMDEPTSALDAETEASLLDALDHLMKGRTTFIIAHRLSTIRRAGRIVFVEAGRIVEQGCHAELVTAGGPYARFHRLQFDPAKALAQSGVSG